MAMQVKNPAAMKLLIGWLIVAALTLAALAAMGFLPPHPGFNSVFIPAVLALLAQGMAAMMAAKRGNARLGWIVLLTPPLLTLGGLLAFFALFAAGLNG